MRALAIALISSFPLMLVACGSSQEPASETSAVASEAPAAVAAAGAKPALWAQCASCHSVEAGKPNGVGPNLHGVVGRKAAAVAGFAYSPAMQNSGLTWDAATLDKYLENPRALVPAGKMVFAGAPDAAKRQALIAWLAEQK